MIASPLGPLLLARTEAGLAGAWFEGAEAPSGADRRAGARRRSAAAARRAPARAPTSPATLRRASTSRSTCRAPPFQRAVWQALLAIDAGTTRSYGDIARELGKPVAVRAVGAAVGRNPVSIIVPCHRVIGSDGSLTGYAGGLDRKTALLRLEAGAPRADRGCALQLDDPLRPRDVAELVGLAALWGGVVPASCASRCRRFGPVALAGAAGQRRRAAARAAARGARRARRAAPALAADRGRRRDELRAAVPRASPMRRCRSTPACSSIFNSASPLFGALIAWLWLRRPADAGARRSASRSASPACSGIGLGQAPSFRPGGSALGGRRLPHRRRSATASRRASRSATCGRAAARVAAGSQLAAQPAARRAGGCSPGRRTPPSAPHWLIAAALAFVCTGLALHPLLPADRAMPGRRTRSR